MTNLVKHKKCLSYLRHLSYKLKIIVKILKKQWKSFIIWFSLLVLAKRREQTWK